MVVQSSSEQLSLTAEAADWLEIHPGYRVLGRIGEDANGPLYKGKCSSDNRKVAIRLFSGDTAPRPVESTQAVVPLAQLVGVHDILESDEGFPLAVMGMPQGICLGTLLSKKKSLPGAKMGRN